jgi:hypothetical protein
MVEEDPPLASEIVFSLSTLGCAETRLLRNDRIQPRAVGLTDESVHLCERMSPSRRSRMRCRRRAPAQVRAGHIALHARRASRERLLGCFGRVGLAVG